MFVCSAIGAFLFKPFGGVVVAVVVIVEFLSRPTYASHSQLLLTFTHNNQYVVVEQVLKDKHDKPRDTHLLPCIYSDTRVACAVCRKYLSINDVDNNNQNRADVFKN